MMFLVDDVFCRIFFLSYKLSLYIGIIASIIGDLRFCISFYIILPFMWLLTHMFIIIMNIFDLTIEFHSLIFQKIINPLTLHQTHLYHSSLPMATISISTSIHKRMKNKSQTICFFCDNDTNNKNWSGTYIVDLVLILMIIDLMLMFGYVFFVILLLLRSSFLNCLCLLFVRVFLGISGVRIDLEVIHTISFLTTLPAN